MEQPKIIINFINPKEKKIFSTFNIFMQKEWDRVNKELNIPRFQNIFLTIQKNKKIIGTIIIRIIKNSAEIRNFIMAKKERNKDIGSYVLGKLENKLFKMGIRRVVTKIDSPLKGALHFYKKNGYEVIDQQKNWLEGTFFWILQKKLTKESIIKNEIYKKA